MSEDAEKIGLLRGQVEGLTRHVGDLSRDLRDHAAAEERILRDLDSRVQNHIREFEGMRERCVTHDELTELKATLLHARGAKDALVWVMGTLIGAATTVAALWRYLKGGPP